MDANQTKKDLEAAQEIVSQRLYELRSSPRCHRVVLTTMQLTLISGAMSMVIAMI